MGFGSLCRPQSDKIAVPTPPKWLSEPVPSSGAGGRIRTDDLLFTRQRRAFPLPAVIRKLAAHENQMNDMGVMQRRVAPRTPMQAMTLAECAVRQNLLHC